MSEWPDALQGPRPIIDPISWADGLRIVVICPECQEKIGLVDRPGRGELRLVVWRADAPTKHFTTEHRMSEKTGHVPNIGLVASGPLPTEDPVRIGLWCHRHGPLAVSVGEIRNALAQSRKRIAARRQR